MFHVYRHLATELGLPADDQACDAFQLAVLRWQPSRRLGRRAEAPAHEISPGGDDQCRFASRCRATRMPWATPSTTPSAPMTPAVAKPNPEFFAYNKGRQAAFGYKQYEILHVAQSQHHDIGIARRLG